MDWEDGIGRDKVGHSVVGGSILSVDALALICLFSLNYSNSVPDTHDKDIKAFDGYRNAF